MAKALDLKVGDEVTICSSDGTPYNIVKVEARIGYGHGGWQTTGMIAWTKSGLRDDGSKCLHRTHIVPTTDAHRRALWLQQTRRKLAREDTWRDVSDDAIENAAKLLGWAACSASSAHR